MTTLLIALLLLSPQTKSEHLSVNYDRITNVTVVATKFRYAGGYGVTARFSYDGHVVSKIVLDISSDSSDWTLLRKSDQTLYLLLDNERSAFAPLTNSSDVRPDRIRGGANVHENIRYVIPADALLKIANSKNVEVRLGAQKFKFGNDMKDSFRQLVDAYSHPESIGH